MLLSTRIIVRWTFMALIVAGCTSPAPESPEPNAAPVAVPSEPAPLDPQTAAPAEPHVAARPENPVINDGPQLVPPMSESANDSSTPIARAEESDPQGRTAFYRGDTAPAEIPPVVMSRSHEALCRVKVGDTMPEIVLPRIGDGSDRTNLAELAGEKATVVVFWTADRRMAHEQLADLGRDVVDLFGDRGVAVIGIAVNESERSADEALQQAGAEFPNLLDPHGDAFAKVGSDRLPRTYLLDSQGKILWFDIEYSLTTRRELNRALRALVGEPADG
jgi:peroxiredoxin